MACTKQVLPRCNLAELDILSEFPQDVFDALCSLVSSACLRRSAASSSLAAMAYESPVPISLASCSMPLTPRNRGGNKDCF